jgi:hypothetical protein
MALLTDEGWIKIEDLSEEDSGLLETSQREGIDLATKLRLAVDDIRSELRSFLRSNSAFAPEQVAVEWELRRWVAYHSISSAYRDAYFHQLNDRYAAKWKLYSEQAKEAREECLSKGVGIIRHPLRRPAAPEVLLLSGSHAPRTYWFSIAWANEQGEYSVPGEARLVKTTGLHGLRIEQGEGAPNDAKWVVYGGPGAQEMTLQTEGALEPGAAWELPERGLVEGQLPYEGQAPGTRVRRRRLLRRR